MPRDYMKDALNKWFYDWWQRNIGRDHPKRKLAHIKDVLRRAKSERNKSQRNSQDVTLRQPTPSRYHRR